MAAYLTAARRSATNEITKMLTAKHISGSRLLGSRRAAARNVVTRTAQVERQAAQGTKFYLTEQQKQAFVRDGFVYIPQVLSSHELEKEVDPAYFKFLRGEVKVPGSEVVDTAPTSESNDPKDFKVYNVMLPRQYYPQWQGNLLEQRCQHIAEQLLDCEDVELDFDQIIAKRPRTKDSVVSWHQDAAYWPEGLAQEGECLGTANVWVAVSDVPVESGCMRYVPGSHRERDLREHEKVGRTTPGPKTLRTQVGGERALLVPMKRGDVVVHTERVVHGSGPNMSDAWRYAYVLNFKRESCVVEERALGYTGAYNTTR